MEGISVYFLWRINKVTFEVRDNFASLSLYLVVTVHRQNVGNSCLFLTSLAADVPTTSQSFTLASISILRLIIHQNHFSDSDESTYCSVLSTCNSMVCRSVQSYDCTTCIGKTNVELFSSSLFSQTIMGIFCLKDQ